MKLVTIPISHYCERARWALDRAGLAFVEEQHLQMLHWPWALARGGTKTVPVLITEDRVLDDSKEIVAFADAHTAPDARLYPQSAAARREIEQLERDFSDPFGVESRRVMYFHFFRWGRPALEFNGGRAPRWEKWLLQAMFPIARRFMRGYLDVSQRTMESARDLVDRTFDDVAARLAKGNGYLVGDHFSAADLTFACMAAAVTAPAEYGFPLPKLDEVPAVVAEVLGSYRKHPAGEFALRMFREHRRPPQ